MKAVLWRGPRLHPRRACEHLGAGLDQDTMARRLKKRRAAVVRHGNAEGPSRCRGTQGSDSERRRAARRDSDDNIVLMNVSIGDGFCAFCLVVFGALHALQYRLHSPGHHENYTNARPILRRTKLPPVLTGDASRAATP